MIHKYKTRMADDDDDIKHRLVFRAYLIDESPMPEER
jgi:hypothetical protein